ncbi:MAG: LamG-like jellyroll fold domain-containing protein [bacterium]
MLGLVMALARSVHAADLPIAPERDAAFYQERDISFYASFEQSLEADYAAGRATPVPPWWEPIYPNQEIEHSDGKYGNAATAESMTLAYDPMRNFFPERGAVSFWFKPDAVGLRNSAYFQVKSREYGVGPNSRRQTDLYNTTFLFGTTPILRDGFHRALIRPALEAIDETFTLPELDPDQWHHFVWTWDNTQGMRVYLNGERIADNWGTVTWIQMMTPRLVMLSSMTACDELILFDRPLTESEALGLYEGELPEPRDQPTVYEIPEPLQRWIAHSYGLGLGTDYPIVHANETTTFTRLHEKQATDSRRPMIRPLDGNRVSAWPISHIEIVNTDNLIIDYAEPMQANYFRVLTDHNRFAARTGDVDEPFWVDEVRPERGGWRDKLVRRHWLDEPITFDQLVLDRKGGRVGEFWAYNVQRRPLEIPGSEPMTLRGAEVRDVRELEWEGGVYQLYHNHPAPAMIMRDQGADAGGSAESTLDFAALVPLHMITQPVEQKTGVAGVTLELTLTPPANKLKQIFRLRIVDPVTKERDLFNTDFKVAFDPEADGPQTFRIALDIRDIVLNEDRRLWAWLVSRDGGTLHLDQSTFTLHTQPADEALEQFVADQLRLIERTYMISSESHPWSRSQKWPGDERYHYFWSEWAPLVNLVREQLAPDNPVVGAYWHALRPRTNARYADHVDYSRTQALRDLPYTRFPATEPANPAGAPQWALYQNELLSMMLSIPQWWHDNRYVPETGILNGYGDDTQFTGEIFWLYFATGDHKIAEMFRGVTEGTWKYAGFYNGYPARTNDVGHNAEEVVGAWPLMILLDYGNPRYVEMTMQTLSLLDFITTVTDRGHRHFRSWYFSSTELITSGEYGVDTFGNSSFTILGHTLSWYNRNPTLTDFYKAWCDAWLEDLDRARDMGIDGAFSVRMPEDEPFVGAFHRMYTMQHQFFVTGLLTGDDRYIKRALHNDDNFFQRYGREYGAGMLLRDFAFQRHRLREEQFAGRPTMRNPANAFARYFVSGDKQVLAGYYKQKLHQFQQGTYHLYTQGQPTTDRLWGLYDPSMFLAYLGGLPAGHRRTSNWPGLAVSYPDAGTDLASLVLTNQGDEAEMLLFNFNADRAELAVRVWQLEPGTYRVTAGPDEDGDDAMDTVSYETTLELRRASELTLPIPHGVLQHVRIKQVEKSNEPEMLPDLALGSKDLRYEAQNNRLKVTIHNIGSEPIGPFRVQVLGEDGEPMAEQDVEGLEAPIDLQPRTVTLSFPLSRDQAQTVTGVGAWPIDETLEVTTRNNRLDTDDPAIEGL